MTSKERHTTIVEAARRLFAERGFRGTIRGASAQAVGAAGVVEIFLNGISRERKGAK
jgi:hypothetical protein